MGVGRTSLGASAFAPPVVGGSDEAAGAEGVGASRRSDVVTLDRTPSDTSTLALLPSSLTPWGALLECGGRLRRRGGEVEGWREAEPRVEEEERGAPWDVRLRAALAFRRARPD